MAEKIVVYRFDEEQLLNVLKSLTHRDRLAFAAASVTRQLPVIEALLPDIALNARLRSLVDLLWGEVQGLTQSGPFWEQALSEVLALLPEKEAVASIGEAIADDALASLSYAIACQIESSPQQAAWAARRAYEAADQVAIEFLGVRPGNASVEAEILACPIVQRELERQKSDLDALRIGAVIDVRRRAYVSPILTREELQRFICASRLH